METIRIHPKSIKIISEYQCYPIWLSDIKEIGEICDTISDNDIKKELSEWLPNIKTEWLSISTSLIKQINEWDAIYQSLFIDTNYEFNFTFKSKEQELQFYEEKQEIIGKLKIEMPNTTIYV